MDANARSWMEEGTYYYQCMRGFTVGDYDRYQMRCIDGEWMAPADASEGPCRGKLKPSHAEYNQLDQSNISKSGLLKLDSTNADFSISDALGRGSFITYTPVSCHSLPSKIWMIFKATKLLGLKRSKCTLIISDIFLVLLLRIFFIFIIF